MTQQTGLPPVQIIGTWGTKGGVAPTRDGASPPLVVPSVNRSIGCRPAFRYQGAVNPISRVLFVCLLATVACGGLSEPTAESEDPFTSDVATLMTFDFDGELFTTAPASPKGQIRAQLLYTVGQLNHFSSVARLDRVQLSAITSTAAGNGLTRIAYHAKLPVAWGSKTNLPASFNLVLPKRVDSTGLSAFFAKYSPACNAAEGHEMMVSNFWYHYRPAISGCGIADADATRRTASAGTSPLNTAAKYPEYHRVWEDRSLDVLAVFGKYAKGATSPYDAGIAAYNEFVAAIQQELGVAPAVSATESIFQKQLANGRSVSVSILMVDEVQSAGPAFDKRYAELSAGADLILYNGHAGLGANVAALALKGAFFPGKYQIVFFDGCDTFAYADDTLATRRAALNPDDPTGSRYLDVVTNAMPAYFSYMSDASMALVRALLNDAAPKTYPAIFHDVARDHVVVATNEEDNVFTPAAAASLRPRWTDLRESGFVGKSESVLYQTAVLPAGTYSFQLTPDPAFPGGDADLRVRAGSAPPLTQEFKCKSYVANSNEKCTLKLAAPAKVFLSVTGDKIGVQSRYILHGWGG